PASSLLTPPPPTPPYPLSLHDALPISTAVTFHRAFATLADPLHRALAMGMMAGLAGLMAHAIGTNTFMLIRIMEPFWLHDPDQQDRKSTRLNSSHDQISYAVFCLKKKK